MGFLYSKGVTLHITYGFYFSDAFPYIISLAFLVEGNGFAIRAILIVLLTVVESLVSFDLEELFVFLVLV